MTRVQSLRRRWNMPSVGDRVPFPLKEKKQKQKEKKNPNPF
jgi:hypothetical protein